MAQFPAKYATLELETKKSAAQEPRFSILGQNWGTMDKPGRCSIKGCKQRGEWAELCFMARAAARGFSVTRPFGDSASYDVGVEHNGKFSRVQVKSTTFQRHGSYTCNLVSKVGVHYERSKVDFFAVYLVPIDLWYIVPFAVAERNQSLNLAQYDGHKFAQYIEAWHLLEG